MRSHVAKLRLAFCWGHVIGLLDSSLLLRRRNPDPLPPGQPDLYLSPFALRRRGDLPHLFADL